MNINEILAANLGVSLEDNAQVEVNFNIDTDENGAPKDDAIEQNTTGPVDLPEPEMDDTEEDSEAEEEAAAADDEVEQLEEAKNSLESLTHIVNHHVDAGTMSRMGIGFYALALESIVPEKVRNRAGCVSLESRKFESRLHAGLMAKVELEEISASLDQVSLEAWHDWIRKAIHRIAVIFRQEKALLKRAQKLLALTSRETHAEVGEQIVVNGGRKTLGLEILLGSPWTSSSEFLTKVKHHNDLYIGLGTLRNGYEDEFTDLMFPDSRRWPKDRDGKPHYEIFSMKLVRNNNVIENFPSTRPTLKTQVPTLTNDDCRAVLESTIQMLEMGDVMEHNLDLMLSVLEKGEKVETSTSTTTGRVNSNTPELSSTSTEETVHTKVSYPEGYVEMFNALSDLAHFKNKTVFEILDYVNYSLVGSEFV